MKRNGYDLATQIGSQLEEVLYILDEPSIGLHQRDNMRLIESLKKLRDVGNSVIVVEHDKEMILESDFVVDIGPKAGKYGGSNIAASGPWESIKSSHTMTSDYLSGAKEIKIAIPKKRQTRKREKNNAERVVQVTTSKTLRLISHLENSFV